MASGRDRIQLPPQVACASPLWKYTQENVVTLKMRPPQNAFTSLDTFMAAHSPRRFCQTRQKYVLKPLALERKIPDSRFVSSYEKSRPESGKVSKPSSTHQRSQASSKDSEMKSSSNDSSTSSTGDSSSEIEHSTRVLALGKCTLSNSNELHCLNDNPSEPYRNTSFRPGPKLPFTFKRTESIPNTPRDASDLIAIGTIPITTQKQVQPKPLPRLCDCVSKSSPHAADQFNRTKHQRRKKERRILSPSHEDNSPTNSPSKLEDDENKLKPESTWKAKATLNLKGNKYPDPMVGASPSLQGRIAEMAQLELDTIKYEKSKRIRKKASNS